MKALNGAGPKGLRCSAEATGQPATGGAHGQGKAVRHPQEEVWDAFKRVKANHGAAGAYRQSIADFEVDLSNTSTSWNRLSSGSYFLRRAAGRSQGNGGTRPLGIPTVADRIAQEVARRYLEPYLEAVFHADAYGYRPGRSAIGAVHQARSAAGGVTGCSIST